MAFKQAMAVQESLGKVIPEATPPTPILPMAGAAGVVAGPRRWARTVLILVLVMAVQAATALLGLTA